LIAGNKRRISAMTYNTPPSKCWTTHDGTAVIDAKARYWSKIAIFAPVRGSLSNIVIMFDAEKLEWCGYPTVIKKV